MFHQFFGENMLRADVCNAVDELGQLLDHTGRWRLGAQRCPHLQRGLLLFRHNGTSTSNKMVWHANVAPDDIVVVDRNCHVSILHAITMTGAIPVFLTPTRNHLGIIGPIRSRNSNPRTSKRRSKPIVCARGEAQEAAHTDHYAEHYDGVLYNVEMLKDTLNSSIDTLHFDEAWLPHATFHDFYKNMHAIGKDRPRTRIRSSTPRTPRINCWPHFAGVADSRAGIADQEARPSCIQRGLPDAYVDFAAVRDHRLLRCGGA